MNSPPPPSDQPISHASDADGRPYEERRHEGQRREDDPAADVARGWMLWAQWMVLNRGKALAVATAIASVLAYAATTIGMRWSGPKQDIERVGHAVDTLGRRVDRIENAADDARKDREQIKQRLDFVVYMQCVQLRRTDPAAVPALCNESRRP